MDATTVRKYLKISGVYNPTVGSRPHKKLFKIQQKNKQFLCMDKTTEIYAEFSVVFILKKEDLQTVYHAETIAECG